MSLFLEEIEIKTFRGINNYSINNFDDWTSITGSNSTSKSSILYALSFLGSNRMHELADVPAYIRKINPRDVPIKISYLFKLYNRFDYIISDERIVNILIESLEKNYKDFKEKNFDKNYLKYLESSLTEMKSKKPMNEIFYDAFRQAINSRDIFLQQTKDKFKPLFNSTDMIKPIDELFENCKYLKIDLNQILSDGPHSRFFLLDADKKTIIDEEVFIHWLSKIQAVNDDITLSYILGATFFKSVLSSSYEKKYSESLDQILSLDGSNIENHVIYTLEHFPDKIKKLNEYFDKIFNCSIGLRKSLPSDSVENTDIILVDLNNKDEWFSLKKLSEGMIHILKILLQFISCESGDILLIDEPELHLHPGALRVLRDILYERKNEIQIICATHSPIMLDTSFTDKIILNKKKSNDKLECDIIDTNNLDLALSELGSNGLDILLFDVLFWVEGPTDELYLKSWLNLLSDTFETKKLSEIGFIRFGSCDNLKHFEVDKIKMVNRNSIFVIDSDKDSESDEISDNKKEFKIKCDDEGIYCWITKKKMIENYGSVYQSWNRHLECK